MTDSLVITLAPEEAVHMAAQMAPGYRARLLAESGLRAIADGRVTIKYAVAMIDAACADCGTDAIGYASRGDLFHCADHATFTLDSLTA